jgi:hypothetical protein
MGIRRQLKKIFRKKPDLDAAMITNLYQTNYGRKVLISYIIAPFRQPNQYKHQNYLTVHIVAESFSALGYDVDIIEYNQQWFRPDYNEYALIFGFGYNFEESFLSANREIPRIHLITGAHQDMHNAMSLKSINDFYQLSGLWMPNEANVLPESSYYAMFNADVTIILAHGYVLEDCRSRFNNKLYSLNNNILGVFSGFEQKTKRTSNFLFLSGSRQVTKGLHLLLEVARLRRDLNFYIVVPHINTDLENYYTDLLQETEHVFLFKDLRMDGEEMKQIITSCSYIVAPSYVDGMPGGTIEPMSGGLIPIVSKYCGFPVREFIFELEELSVEGLHAGINRVLELEDSVYFDYSNQVKAYATEAYSPGHVKEQLMKILAAEL